MAIFKCKMCGGDLNVEDGVTVAVCEYCETKQTIPCLDNEKKLNLFNRANRLRMNSEFDKAAAIYENIVAEFPEEAEAYWGLCLCNYGIEYVDDPATAKKIPTCHRASFESLQSDENFELALEYADVVAQKVYRDEAREIDRIMQEILAVSKNEKPYDVFICYKETDEKGERTVDSVLAHDIYDALTAKGLNVFFARITLEDKLGRQYEPYIFAALNSAKVMLAIGTKYEYYNAVWVKNEWSRFLKLMAKDKSKVLIPCFKDIDAYDIPEEFKNLQAQDMSKLGFIQDLVRGVEKIVGKEMKAPVGAVAAASPVQTQNNLVAPLIERAFMFLEDGKWESADEYCEKALDLEPKNANAYLGKLLAEFKKHNINELENLDGTLFNSDNLNKVIAYADAELSLKIDALTKKIKQAMFEKSAEIIYEKAKNLAKTNNKNYINNALIMFTEISGYLDADEYAEKCKEQLELIEKAEALYNLNKEMVSEKLSVLNNLYAEKNAALSKKATDAGAIIVPADEQIQIIENKIKQLRAEYSSLGLFKKKEKQAVQEKINAEEKKLSELKLVAEKERNDIATKKAQALKTETEEKVKKLDYSIEQALEDLYQFGLELIEKTDYKNAKAVFSRISGYKDSAEKLKTIPSINEFDSRELSRKMSVHSAISSVVDKNGKVVTAYTEDCKDDIDCSEWSDIISVSCGSDYNVDNRSYECSVVGVQADNTLVCTGAFRHEDVLKTLNNIETVRFLGSSLSFTRNDGLYGNITKEGEINEHRKDPFYEGFSKVLTVLSDYNSGLLYSVGIINDGSLCFIKRTIDANEQYVHECSDIKTADVPGYDFSNWDSIVDFKQDCVYKDGQLHYWLVGVKSDGTVVATGPHPECYNGVENWKNVKEVFTIKKAVLGVTFDGKLLATKGAFTEEQSPFLDKVKAVDLSKLEKLQVQKKWEESSYFKNGFILLYGLTSEGKIVYCLHRQSESSPDIYPDINCGGVMLIEDCYNEIAVVCDDGSLKYVFGPKDYSSLHKLIKENPDLRLF